MYFLDLKGLVAHLKAEKNTERESFQYTIGAFILSSFTGNALNSSNDTNSIFDLLIRLISLGVVIFIGYNIYQYFYSSNKGDNGKYFLHRMLALYFVVNLRVGLVACPIYVVGFAILKFYPKILTSPFILYPFYTVFIMIAVYLFYYYVSRIGRSLQEISGWRDSNDSNLVV